jgi:uncharacterized ferritin-like protein (DUF455 family)
MDLSHSALSVLLEANANNKATLTKNIYKQWQEKKIDRIGLATAPLQPNRPEKPELISPAKMPKRRKAGTLENKIALLHAIAHIELNAIDLAWDIICRFSYYAEENNPKEFSLPNDFYSDWCKVAMDEAKHFTLLNNRLNELGAKYGDLPAHNGLWEAAEKTANDFSARLAIVPMVLEARGLDVTPFMIKSMLKQKDHKTAEILQIIHDEEIDHVLAGTRWFRYWCNYHGKEVKQSWQGLVKTYFNGQLKPPFNTDSREKAGLIRDWYEQIANG